MSCPICCSNALLLIALAGERRRKTLSPVVFLEYCCEQGHCFKTIKTFDGQEYQENYVWLSGIQHTASIN